MSQTNESTLSVADIFKNLEDPYPLYQRLREADPVYWDERAKSWVLTRYADNAAALRDPRYTVMGFMSNTSWIPEDIRPTLEPPLRAVSRQMLFQDPPDHTRLRGLVAKAFTPRMIESLRPVIQRVTNELLDQAEAKGHMELIREFAFPLPAIIIATMLGVPPEDREQFNRWSSYFGRLLDGGDFSLESVFEAVSEVSDFLDYFRSIIHARRALPKDDLMQAMIDAEEQGDALSEDELLGNCILILAAGHGTTTHLIGNGTLALLRHPDQVRLLQEQPSLVTNAVTELLRYDSPVQLTSRHAKEALQIGGKQVSLGQEVIMLLGAANHDPEQFADPDRLMLSRQENRHLSFGLGVHFCLGAPLARVEGEIAFSSLFKRFPNLHLETDEVEWQQSIVFRGLKQLPVNLRRVTGE
jgi:cytochrome P450